MLYERLNVPLIELAGTDPEDWKLERGRLTTRDLSVYAGRSILHWRRDTMASVWPHKACGRDGGKIANRLDEITCILCLTMIAQRAALCCTCSIEFRCGCRCSCHRKNNE